MQNKTLQRLRHIFEAAIYYSVLGLLKLTPRSKRADICGALVSKLGTRIGANKRIYKNLDIGMPGLSSTEKDAIAKGVWQSLGRTYAEVLDGDKLAHPETGIVEAINFEAYQKVRDEGRGAIMIGAHFSNWELSVLFAGYALKDFAGFYRRQNNPLIDASINRLRTRTGAKLIAKNDRQGLRKALVNLRNGGSVGILMDQHLRGGEEIPFLAKPANTMPLAFSIAKSTGAAVIPYRLKRLPDKTYACIFQDEVKIDEDLGTDLAKTAFLNELNRIIGEWIKEDPDQWFWLHNRWRIT